MMHDARWPAGRLRPRAGHLALSLALLWAAACGESDRSSDTNNIGLSASTPGSMPMTDSSHTPGMQGMTGMQGMANMTGDPDRDFLRMMSDHHRGMIEMAHQAKD